MISDKELLELERLLDESARELAKCNYIQYVKYTNPTWQELIHSAFIANIVDEAVNKRVDMLSGLIPMSNQYIMASLPPRHGKSLTITETLPSYFMGRFNGAKVILTAYSSTLANDFAKSNSRKIEEYNVFNAKVLIDNQDRLELSNGSICIKAGILGGITGKGAHLLLIDDPIKTSEEAMSEVTRDKIWKEWESSLSTRLEEAAIVIVIMTRWHEDDLAGRLLNPAYGDPLPWNVVNLPLEAEDNDQLGRPIGEPLWPERYGQQFIAERKQYASSFNSLYQGRPSSMQGNIIQRTWFQWYDQAEITADKMIKIIMSVDATFKETEKSDKVSIQIWGKRGASMYLMDRVSGRMGFIATIQAIENMLKKYPQIVHKYIEDKANGSAIIDVLNRKFHGVIAINPQGSKEARVHSVLPFLEAGNVFLPRTPWADEVVEQCASFPKGANDDDVDALSQALNKLSLMPADIPDNDPRYVAGRLVVPKRSEWSTQIPDGFFNK